MRRIIADALFCALLLTGTIANAIIGAPVRAEVRRQGKIKEDKAAAIMIDDGMGKPR